MCGRLRNLSEINNIRFDPPTTLLLFVGYARQEWKFSISIRTLYYCRAALGGVRLGWKNGRGFIAPNPVLNQVGDDNRIITIMRTACTWRPKPPEIFFLCFVNDQTIPPPPPPHPPGKTLSERY